MKKYILIMAISTSCLFCGCSKNLNVTPTDVFASGNMWEDDMDITSSVYGMYSFLRSALKDNIINWGEYRNGLWGAGTFGTLADNNMVQIASNTMTPKNAYSEWTSIYKVINQANLILKYASKTHVDNETKNFGLSQAYFVRAFCYFWLGRIWGDSPLALEGFESTTQEFELERSPQIDVFNQVRADIDSSAIFMQNSYSDKTVATIGSLRMLQADFGLWMYKVVGAGNEYLDMAETAIQSLNLNIGLLESNYADIFSSSNKQGKEIIWTIPQSLDESTGGFAGVQFFNQTYIKSQYINNTVPIGNNQWWVYTNDYINIILSDVNDQRSNVTYGHGPYGSNGEEIKWANKFKGELVSGTRVFNSDIPIYRYSQAYLFLAEINYYKKLYSKALDALSPITQRAYGNPNYYTSQSEADVLNALIKENLKEFASESNTFWTLIRTDKIWDYNPSLAQQKNKKNILLWPVSENVLKRNVKLNQTLGWGE